MHNGAAVPGSDVIIPASDERHAIRVRLPGQRARCAEHHRGHGVTGHGVGALGRDSPVDLTGVNWNPTLWCLSGQDLNGDLNFGVSDTGGTPR